MDERLRSGIDSIRNDTTSGATDLVARAAALVLAAKGDAPAQLAIAAECVRAQPSMAGMLTLEQVVRTAADPDSAVQQFATRLQRAPGLIARHAVPLLLLGAPLDPSTGQPALTIVTISRSRAVEETLRLLATRASVRVRCGEGRPAREGAVLAGLLGQLGVEVELFSDAGLSAAVPGTTAVLVGADAVGDEWFVNKVGTAAICALAIQSGVLVYVLAGRDRRVSGREFERLTSREGLALEIQPGALRGVTVRNPYFERIPVRLASQFVSDGGVQMI